MQKYLCLVFHLTAVVKCDISRNRDKERFQGLVLLQAAIALCFFHHLPEDLVHFIFTVDFLERLDEEILNCYAKVCQRFAVIYYGFVNSIV
jgi:hypothetical protein